MELPPYGDTTEPFARVNCPNVYLAGADLLQGTSSTVSLV